MIPILKLNRTETFINMREISKRIRLPEGRYCIIPSTFQTGEEGEFLLRIFVEKNWGTSDRGRGKVVDRHSAVGDATDGGGGGSEGLGDLNIGGSDEGDGRKKK